MKQKEHRENQKIRKMLNGILKNPKKLGTAVVVIAALFVATTVIVGAGYLNGGFNPDAYLQNKNNSNDVAYDSTVFGADQNNQNAKEMDDSSKDDYNLEDGNDPLNEEQSEDLLQIQDNSGNATDDNNGSTGGVSASGVDDGNAPTVIVQNPGNGGTPGGNSNGGSGNGNNNNGSDNGNKKPDDDKNDDPTDNPNQTNWQLTGLTATSLSGTTSYITVYQYMTLTEDVLRNKIIVTASYQDKNDASKTKSEVVENYSLSGIPQDVLNRELSLQDTGRKFDMTVTYQGISRPVNCTINRDYMRFERVSVTSDTMFDFAVGDVLGSETVENLLKHVHVTAYGYTNGGRLRITINDFQNYNNGLNMEIAFHDKNGNTGGTITADKSVTAANIILKDELLKTTTLTDVVKYNVYDYKLTVMYYNDSVLKTIYQNDRNFNLVTSSNGAQSVYNQMVERMIADDMYHVDQAGNSKEIFYGWSLFNGDTDYKNAITSYQMSATDHSGVLYPLPLVSVEQGEYQIRYEDNEQVLVGFTGDADNLEVPYGVTSIRIDKDFYISDSASEHMNKITIPSTVHHIDFSAVEDKFPNLTDYVADNSSVYQTENGVLYTDAQSTLLRLPVQGAERFTVSKSISKIAEGALDDAVANLLSQKKELTLVMEADENSIPPILEMTDSLYKADKGGLVIQIPDTSSDYVTADYYLKYYAASWGTMLDEAFDEEGYALDQVLCTPSNAQIKYENKGNNVYSTAGLHRTLEFAATDAGSEYTVDSTVKTIAGYAFDKASNVNMIRVPDSVTEFEDYCFAFTGEHALAGVQISGTQKASIGADVAGTIDSENLKNNSFHIFVSSEQEKASSWLSSLEDSYGRKKALQILIENDGTMEVIDDCIYFRDNSTRELTLYYVPSDHTEYTAPYNLTTVAQYAFADSQAVKLVLPEVTTVESEAFDGCDKLEMLVLSSPEPVSVQADMSQCPELKVVLSYNADDLQVPEDTEILNSESDIVDNDIIYQQADDHAEVIFAPSDIAGVISLKDDTTIIKANAFAGCQDLIGFSEDQWSKIERIEAYAFDGCSKLNSADGTPAPSGANLQLREDVQPGQLELYAAFIGEYAFRGCESITQLYLNAGVTEIGERAFADCGSLTYVYWRADTTSVGDYLFENCVQIMSVNIGDETLDMNNVPVTTVGNYTFQNCKKLISLNMFSSISHIGNYAFAGCESMTVATEIYSDNSLSEGKIESIGDYAFSGCFRINTIFSGSDMLTHYGEGAFMNCSKVLDDKTKVGLISVALPANLKEVPDYCFMGSECLKTLYETKAHIERIGKAAFSGCTSLTRVYDIEVQNTLTSIDDYAFSAYTYEGRDYEACIELTGLELPRNITSIGTYSFAGNTALKNVDFSRSSKLEQIGESAFEGCVNMKAADLNNTKLTQLNTNVFKDSEKITTVILPATLKSAAAGALDGCDSVSVIMCKSQDMVSLVSGTLGSTGKNEELTVFVPAKDDHSLKNEYCGDPVWIAELGGRQEEVIAEIGGDSVVYNGGIYNIDDNGEYVLTSVLTSKTGALELHGNTVSIAKDAFKGCNKITMIIMPEKIEKLSEGIFEDCSNLEVLLMSHKETSEDKTSVSLPEVEGNLFGSAARNENFRVAVEETMVDDYDGWIDAPVMDYGYDYYIDSDVLYGYFLDEMEEDYIELLYVPRSYEGDLDIYIDTIYIADSAAEGCTKLKNVDVSTRTERIGTRAFAKCSSLESVFIANTNNTRLTEIGEEAFMDCVSLVGRSSSYSNRLTIPVSIKKIGRAAFKNCTSLSYFSVQGTLSEIADETFSGCTSLGTFMSTTAGFSAIERIGKKAFYGCTSITSISWTNMTNLSVVDDSAYEGCSNLILATFADKLTRIGSRAFQGTGLVSISLNGATPPELGDEVMDANMQSNIVIYVTGTASEQNYKNAWGSKYPALASRVQGLDCTTFRMVSNVLYMVNPQNARELTAIKVPAVLSSVSFYNASSLYCIGIADEALAGCNQISKITITSNIKTIGNKAFADCTNLSNVVMSNQVLTSIGTEAFKNCTSLTSLDIPSSVTDLGADMLEGAVNFSELYLTSSIPPSVGTKLFGDTISENIKVYVPEGTVDLYVQRWSLVLDKDYGVGTAERIITTEALETAAVSAEGDLLSQSEDTGTTEETMGSDAPDSSIVTGDSNAETDNNDTGANNSSTEINNGNTEANNDNTETNSGNTETNNSSTGADAKNSDPDNKQ